ncbi:hypothetical protein FD23_GL000308 [Lactobacillus delbrueckii subsp. delbrueckii DSM 20074 = JCM 1012]|nr:hypothetical protein FD23_GL000308 [Lactobacillus delbrueckii subsp. delbrueckii DSM 20074 = JCM 1012]
MGHFKATNMSTALFESWACELGQPDKPLRQIIGTFFTNTR